MMFIASNSMYKPTTSAGPYFLVQASRIVGQRPLDYIRRQAWTATPTRFGNGLSAVTSLCLVDEPSARGKVEMAEQLFGIASCDGLPRWTKISVALAATRARGDLYDSCR